MASVALRRRKSLLGEGEEEQGRGPHRWANGADAEELRSDSSEALGGCDGGELGVDRELAAASEEKGDGFSAL
jgi:hypothetical protein